MTARTAVPTSALTSAPTPTIQDFRRSPGVPLLLRLQLFTLVACPSYLVLVPAGASGAVPQLLGLAVLGMWVTAALFGRFDAWQFRHPGRVAMLVWVAASCVSYAALFAGLSGASTVAERSAADRWLLLVLAGVGITLAVTQCLLTKEDVRRAVGWLLAGASVCGIVATIQFTTLANPVESLEPFMVGFEDNGSGTPFMERGAFPRVAGTTMHPIELGIVSSMLLPLSVWWALFSTQTRRWLRWTPTMLLLLSSVFTVSRSAMIGLVVAAIVMIPYLPVLARRWALVIAPAFVVALFVAIPGMVSTLLGAATAGNADPSISARTDDYPLAWTVLVQRPWLGHGPGTWMPKSAFDIFDNQYLFTAVTMGVVGLLALLVYLLVPAFTSLLAARHAKDPELRLLAASCAAAMFVAVVASGTFDSFSFQTFALLTPFFVGLGGTAWLLIKQAAAPDTGPVPAGPDRQTDSQTDSQTQG